MSWGCISDEGGFESDFSSNGTINIKANPVFITEADTKVFTLHFKITDSAEPGDMGF